MEGPDSHSLIFLGGLHRSGTTLVARTIAQHPAVSGFVNTTVPEDEGEHLQSVYPHSWEFGGVGRFALEPQMHLVESTPLVDDSSRQILWAEWSRWWDLSKPYLLEKSPPNMLKMRFLQALFPRSSFVLVMRHPIAVVAATLKWWPPLTRSLAPHRLLRHWLHAYETALSDSALIRCFHLLRYEDLVSAPQRELERLSAFLHLTPGLAAQAVRSSHNDRYFAQWRKLSSQTGRREYVKWIEQRYEAQIRRFGYSFMDAVEPGGPVAAGRPQPLLPA